MLLFWLISVLNERKKLCICVEIQIFGWNAQLNWNVRQKRWQIFINYYGLAKMWVLLCRPAKSKFVQNTLLNIIILCFGQAG